VNPSAASSSRMRAFRGLNSETRFATPSPFATVMAVRIRHAPTPRRCQASATVMVRWRSSEAWTREPGTGWREAEPDGLDAATVDAHAVTVALPPSVRVAAEDRGLEFVEGALARHCRVAVDGTTLIEAFPQTRWLLPDGTPAERWWGEVDFWVFLDGQVGLVEAFANGTAGELRPGALQGTVRVRMTATDRGVPVTLAPPG